MNQFDSRMNDPNSYRNRRSDLTQPQYQSSQQSAPGNSAASMASGGGRYHPFSGGYGGYSSFHTGAAAGYNSGSYYQAAYGGGGYAGGFGGGRFGRGGFSDRRGGGGFRGGSGGGRGFGDGGYGKGGRRDGKGRDDLDNISLPRQDFVSLVPFENNFYLESPSVKAMTDHDVAMYRGRREITVQGNDVPKPIRMFSESNFPGTFTCVGLNKKWGLKWSRNYFASISTLIFLLFLSFHVSSSLQMGIDSRPPFPLGSPPTLSSSGWDVARCNNPADYSQDYKRITIEKLLWSSLVDLKADMRELKADMRELKADIKELKIELKADIRNIERKTENIKSV